MKLLDYPTDLPLAEVIVMCDTWEQFDQACAWFIKNGAALEVRRPDDFLVEVPVQMRHGAASYLGSDGRMYQINSTLGAAHGGSVNVEEVNVLYEVHYPSHIR